MRGAERWEVLEKIGAYAAGELEGEEVREAEQLIFDRPEYRRLAESYARMLVLSLRTHWPIWARKSTVHLGQWLVLSNPGSNLVSRMQPKLLEHVSEVGGDGVL